MTQRWAKFQTKIESEVNPILAQAGYILREDGPNEDNNGFLYMYEKDSTHRISIDVLKGMSVVAGSVKNFNCVRVEMTEGYLKALIGKATNTNIFLQQGWIWVSDEELDQCIEEISNGLKAYFETH